MCSLAYRGYRFPKDAGLLTGLFFLLAYYSVMINFMPVPRILRGLSEIKKDGRKITAADMMMLDKMWRGCGFFLKRVFHTDKPCLRRTLVLYRWCRGQGLEARAVIGVCKEDGGIKGHSWLLIEGVPFNEEPADLEKFMPMLEG